jgi:outer membrane protein assembly factor BamD (BamD/ComL family)
MDTYVPQEILDEIYQLTEEGKYEEAIKIINSILAKNPKNEQALLMITDVLYRQ